jgi:hypothetical protein
MRTADERAVERAAALEKLLADPKVAAKLTPEAFRKAGTSLGGISWGGVAVFRSLKHEAIADFGEDDLLNLVDYILKRSAEDERRKAQKDATASITAARLRKKVTEHLEVLKAEAAERERELQDAKREQRRAAARLAEFDQPVHRQKLREAIENVSVQEARASGARAKAAEFERSMKANKKQFDKLVALGVRGASANFAAIMKEKIERVEGLTREIAEIGKSLLEESTVAQRMAAEARELARELHVPPEAIICWRSAESVDVSIGMARAGVRGAKKAGLSRFQFVDLFDIRRHGD